MSPSKYKIQIDDLIASFLEEFPNYLSDFFNNDDKANSVILMESIENGVSGFLLVLLEIYKYMPREDILEMLRSSTLLLIQKCKINPNPNNSLYSGRSGIVYILIDIYNTCGFDFALDASLNFVRTMDIGFMKSDYVTNYLHDGKVGMLLVIVKLYLLSEQLFLLDIIRELCMNVCLSAQLCYEGTFWQNKEEVRSHPSTGFAFGSSGILYVISQIQIILQDTQLQLIIEDVYRFNKMISSLNVQSCEIKDYSQFKHYDALINCDIPSLNENKFDISWETGASGQLFGESLIFAHKSEYKERLNYLKHYLIENSNEPGCDFNWRTVLTVFKLSYNENPIDSELWIGQVLKRRFTLEFKEFKQGLFSSQLGKFYFILKLTNWGKDADCILFPSVFNNNMEKGFGMEKLRFDFLFTIEKCCVRYFPKSIQLATMLGVIEENKYIKDLGSDGQSLLRSYETFLQHKVFDNENEWFYGALNEIISYEISKNEFHEHPQNYIIKYIEGIRYRDDVVDALNKPDSWLFQQKLVVNPSIKIFHLNWDWLNILTEKDSLLKPKPTEIAIYNSFEGKVKEVNMSQTGIVLHRFDLPTTIINVLIDIRSGCQILERSHLLKFVNITGATDIDDFYSRLDFILLQTIKGLLFNRILIFAN